MAKQKKPFDTLRAASSVERLPVVTLIGAGSRIFSFLMCTDICQTPALKGVELRLVDVDGPKLEQMKKLFELTSGFTKMDLRVSTFTDRNAALPGTDFVIISVARDRINRWDTDLALSRKYGIVETQGECGGPGGLSLTLRNVPLMLEIAKDIEKLAPKAVVLNFSNPMTRVCTALTRYTKLKTVGLCHGINEARHTFQQLTGRPVSVRGCGINHFNWLFAATFTDTGEDAWPVIVEKFRASSLQNWKYIRELFEVFDRIVTPGDSHMADFMWHWRGSQDGLNPRYTLKPKEMASYHRKAAEWEDRIADYLGEKTGKPKNPMARVKGLSGEGAIPIVCAMSGITPPYHEIAADIPNKGYITNLPEGAVLELPAFVSKGKIEGERMGNLPTGIQSLLARQLDIAELAVEAAVEGNYQKALQALAIDPILPDLQIARSYLNDVLEAHKDLLPQFTS